MPRGDQIVRQWRVLRLLEGTRRGMRAPEIRTLLGGRVSERTVFRDLQHLQDAGFALVEADGGWRAIRAQEAGLTVPISPSEILGFVVALRLLAPIRGSELFLDAEALAAKLRALLSPQGRALLEALDGVFAASFAAGSEYEARSEELRRVESAVQLEQCLEIDYAPPGRTVETRVIEPHCLWLADGRLYVIAWCRSREDFRVFLLDRMRRVVLLDDTFDRRPSFDSHDFVGAGFGVWSGAPEEVVIDFEPEVAHLTTERRFHASQRAEVLPNGRTRLTMRVAGLPKLAAWVAGLGGRALPRSPPALVEMVRGKWADGLAAFDADPG